MNRLSLFLFLLPFISWSQRVEPIPTPPPAPEDSLLSRDLIPFTPETTFYSAPYLYEAQYTGGLRNFQKFIQDSLSWNCIRAALPDTSIEKTTLRFLMQVDSNGQYSQIRIIRGIHTQVDSCFLEVLSKMPPWQPARNTKDQPVSSRVMVPIQFRYD